MFASFFPKPRAFFVSAVLFAIFSVAAWYYVARPLGVRFGIQPLADDADPVLGPAFFVTPQALYGYAYFITAAAAFCAYWFRAAPHRWQWWSIGGSLLIIFSTYFSVQVSVAINNWRRPFFDAVQNALSGKSTTTAAELYKLNLVFCAIAFVWIAVYVATKFFVSHYIFRWRTAMNDYYIARWSEVRTIEGAAQRVQEDTMRFATIVEELGVSIIEAVMTLVAFIPVLYALSAYVTELPIVGAIAAPLLIASICWSIFGTALLAIVGIKLPGLNFRNQRVEAAYRKELVYGEDDAGRARPATVSELFANLRTNYFRLYFHYTYFNAFRGFYLQADAIFAYIILVPTIAAGKITFGQLQQILTAFSQVSTSFQYLVNSWTTIVELLSIHKRLAAFEAAFEGRELTGIEAETEATTAPQPPM